MKAALCPFSIGARNCPGQNIALMDLRIMFSIILRNFHISPAPQTTEASMSPRELTVRVKGVLKMLFSLLTFWAKTIDPVARRCDLIFRSRI